LIFKPATDVKIKEIIEKAGKVPLFSIIEFLEKQLDARHPISVFTEAAPNWRLLKYLRLTFRG
jgi:hypothetical protein